MTEDENNGYGYVVDGKIDLRTVGPTEVSAMVNALVIHLGYTPKATDTTGHIRRAFDTSPTRRGTVEEVGVFIKPQLCEECGQFAADYPAKVCIICHSYKDHMQ